MKIRLVTESDELVRDTEIIDYTPSPEVLMWGNRTFVKTNKSLMRPSGPDSPTHESRHIFREGVLIHID